MSGTNVSLRGGVGIEGGRQSLYGLRPADPLITLPDLSCTVGVGLMGVSVRESHIWGVGPVTLGGEKEGRGSIYCVKSIIITYIMIIQE